MSEARIKEDLTNTLFSLSKNSFNRFDQFRTNFNNVGPCKYLVCLSRSFSNAWNDYRIPLLA